MRSVEMRMAPGRERQTGPCVGRENPPRRPMASEYSEKGAAAEPEPEPGPPAAAAAAAATTPTSYDPRVYQPPHPDDRDGGGDGKLTKKGGDSKGKGKAKGDDGTHRCGNCDAPDAKRKCNGCGVERYCGEECQKVRAVRCSGVWYGGGQVTFLGVLSRRPPNPLPPTPGALEVRRPQERLPRLRPRGRRPRAAEARVQGGVRGRPVPYLSRAPT